MPTGVQIVMANPGDIRLDRRRYEPDCSFWDFFVGLANREFKDIAEIEGMRLVSVDVNGRESQFSFQP